MDNLLTEQAFTAELAGQIAERIIDETSRDLIDRRAWDDKCAVWTELWACEPPDRSDPPWEGSANVVVPLVASACEQAHNRAYAAYFDQPNPEQVKCLPVAENDVARVPKVEKCMNWQVGAQITEYEPEHDRMLAALPNDGVAWKKWWWDTEDEKRARVMFVPGSEIIVPYGTRPHQVHRAPRITHRYKMAPAEIEEKIRTGFFHCFDKDIVEKIKKPDINAGQMESVLSGDMNKADYEAESPAQATSDSISGFEASDPGTLMHVIFERHEMLEMPDGSRMAVIVWVDKTDSKVLRIASREVDVDGEIKILHQFVDYHFIYNPYGFYSYGYGHFLGPLNEIANTIFNQYIDAGKVSNLPFVFYTAGAGFRKRRIKLAPGEGIQVRDIAQIKIEKMAGLDGSLAQLLTIIDRYGSDMSDNTDEARGRVQKGVREPTVRGQSARLEQTLMGFGVKIRRMISSTRREMELLFDLNSVYLDEELQHRILGSTEDVAFNKVQRKDFGQRLDIVPTASPGYVSRAQLRQEVLDLTDVLIKMPNALAPRADGSVALPVLADAVLKKLLTTHSFGELARYVPEPPAPPMPPGVEHQSWLEGTVPEPSELEDFADHIAKHGLFINLRGHELEPEILQQALMHVRIEQMHLMAQKQQAAAPPTPFGAGTPTIGAPGAPDGGAGAPPAGEQRTDFAGQPPMVN